MADCVHSDKRLIIPSREGIQANNNLRAIPPEAITPALIRKSFEPCAPRMIDPLIEVWNYEKLVFRQQTPYVEAATLMLLVENEQGIDMLLTKRANHLKKHSGQISFPGGRAEPEDPSAYETALRETQEEIGVASNYIQNIGELPSVLTGTGFLMKPFVGFLKLGYDLNINDNEVDEVFFVPLPFLMNPNNHYLSSMPISKSARRQYFSVTWKDYFIWGATAAVIRNFYLQVMTSYK